jgi:hypothetical protein
MYNRSSDQSAEIKEGRLRQLWLENEKKVVVDKYDAFSVSNNVVWTTGMTVTQSETL